MEIYKRSDMKKLILPVLLSLMAFNAFAWTRLGHAVVAKIAEDHLTPVAKAKIYGYLNGESIVRHASSFMLLLIRMLLSPVRRLSPRRIPQVRPAELRAARCGPRL